jgi:hypothetical protein
VRIPLPIIIPANIVKKTPEIRYLRLFLYYAYGVGNRGVSL